MKAKMKFMRNCFILLLLFPLLAGAQTKPAAKPALPSFIITGKIKSIPEKSSVILSGFSGTDTLAKATVKNGTFILKGHVKATDACIISFPDEQKRIILFMGNNTVSIKSADDDMSDIAITGAPANLDYDEFLYDIKPLNDFVNMYRSQMQSAQSQEAYDSLMIMLNTSYNIYQSSVDRFLTRKHNSAVAALLLAYSYDTDPNKDVFLLQKRFESLTGEALESQFAKNIQTVIERDKVGAVGSKAINFTQKDTSGRDVSLSEFKGKYVLIDFWASWCHPCRLENPNVVAAYNKYKEKNFTILGVSLDSDRRNWIFAINKDKLEWTQVSDLKFWGNEVAGLYNIRAIPQNLLLDPDGKIIAKNLKGEELDQKLSEILN